MPNIDKLIVTNRGVLATKYGSAVGRIDDAVDALVKADERRGIKTRLVALDDDVELGSNAVSRPKDVRVCKQAIDRLVGVLKPDYLMILGARDVVPHQSLRNTKRDGDPEIPSDLPYACDVPHTRDPRKFFAPTRVIGRLPDVTGAKDPAYLVSLLRHAARSQSRPRTEYEGFFGLSALAWKESTDLSLRNLFGRSGDLRTSPKEGPRWLHSLLARRVHFINCHGGAADTAFYGEDPETEEQPEAMKAKLLESRDSVSEGAVVAAECCYGADLFDPKESHGQRGICYIYLAQGCYGFFGSTCTAYGPAEGNGQADLICQYFLERVLRGASLGRAALEAQLRFVQACGSLQPDDVKTLAQFLLLGDPSVQPVARAKHGLANSKAYRKALDDRAGRKTERIARRTWALRNSQMVRDTVGKASLPGPFRGSARLRGILLAAAREAGVRKPTLSSHSVSDPVGDKLWRKASGKGGGRTSVHVATGNAPRKRGAKVVKIVTVVATVHAGHIVSLRRLYSR